MNRAKPRQRIFHAWPENPRRDVEDGSPYECDIICNVYPPSDGMV